MLSEYSESIVRLVLSVLTASVGMCRKHGHWHGMNVFKCDGELELQ
jgi:hypothetical protein